MSGWIGTNSDGGQASHGGGRCSIAAPAGTGRQAEAGTANTGGGGGGFGDGGWTEGYDDGGNGGSGYVAIVEPASFSASGVWNMDDVYTYVTDENWA